MKSERPDLPLTIAWLVRSATPVTPLEPPPVRLARWAIASTALALVSVAILGVRSDVATQMMNGWFVARATATLAMVIAAAIVAFLMSVPGAERSRLVRALPLAACLVWAVMLVGTIAANGSPLEVLLQVTPHFSCVLLIAATAITPGVMLVRMLRHAAPLQARWTGGFAGLASLALGALGTQFVCTNDAAAHHLLWHFTPVVLLALAGVAVGSSLFGWPHHQEPHST
ncbi:MAG TPA: DUF1109 domain-containing protein [Vicinamibacterales bacterium]|nr:DUF1109 domain-containing protein [Vicinamibacterales bacterium]